MHCVSVFICPLSAVWLLELLTSAVHLTQSACAVIHTAVLACTPVGCTTMMMVVAVAWWAIVLDLLCLLSCPLSGFWTSYSQTSFVEASLFTLLFSWDKRDIIVSFLSGLCWSKKDQCFKSDFISKYWGWLISLQACGSPITSLIHLLQQRGFVGARWFHRECALTYRWPQFCVKSWNSEITTFCSTCTLHPQSWQVSLIFCVYWVVHFVPV